MEPVAHFGLGESEVMEKVLGTLNGMFSRVSFSLPYPASQFSKFWIMWLIGSFLSLIPENTCQALPKDVTRYTKMYFWPLPNSSLSLFPLNQLSFSFANVPQKYCIKYLQARVCSFSKTFGKSVSCPPVIICNCLEFLFPESRICIAWRPLVPPPAVLAEGSACFYTSLLFSGPEVVSLAGHGQVRWGCEYRRWEAQRVRGPGESQNVPHPQSQLDMAGRCANVDME